MAEKKQTTKTAPKKAPARKPVTESAKKPATKKVEPRAEWLLIDAKDAVLGRLASDVAVKLTEKDSPQYEPHRDLLNRHVVVTNAANLKLDQKKLDAKMYYRHSWYLGGLKEATLQQMMDKDPRKVIEIAVAGMLPKNKMHRPRMKRLHVYVDDKHPHPQVKGDK